jgi:single-strand DNA-binding protein
MSDIVVVGNMGSEPELRFSQAGKAILSFSLAEGHRKKVNGEWEDAGTTWRRVTVWEDKAELYAEHLSKGQRVMVQGSEELKTFETKEGGEGKSLELTARNIGIIPKASKGQSQPPQQSQADPWGAGDDTPPF